LNNSFSYSYCQDKGKAVEESIIYLKNRLNKLNCCSYALVLDISQKNFHFKQTIKTQAILSFKRGQSYEAVVNPQQTLIFVTPKLKTQLYYIKLFYSSIRKFYLIHVHQRKKVEKKMRTAITYYNKKITMFLFGKWLVSEFYKNK